MQDTAYIVNIRLYDSEESMHLFSVIQQLIHTLSKRFDHLFDVASVHFSGNILLNVVNVVCCHYEPGARIIGASFDAQCKFGM